ncbi:MAG: glycosyltransferase family 39 protein [Planctomycetes bacterium]|nr:glycosyltransferase family 39 protein [Planctomycetota bacterium]
MPSFQTPDRSPGSAPLANRRRQRDDAPTDAAEKKKAHAAELHRWVARATWCVLAVGVAARLVRFLLRFPLWGDELMLAENLVTRDVAGLIAPLDHGQVAPLGYLWAEWGLTRLLGFNEWTLRAVALVASVAGLFVVRRLAVRWLSSWGALVAVGCLAIGYFPIRHAAEVKPYSLDLLCTAVTLALATRWFIDRDRNVWLWALAAWTPLAVLCSFPTVFVTAAAGVAALGVALVQKRWKAVAAIAVWGLIAIASFGAVYYVSTSAQSATYLEQMRGHWRDSFPPSPLSHPWLWCQWMLNAVSGEVFAYPFGSDHGGSTLTVVLMALGVWAVWRKGERWFLGMTVSVFGLAYTAAWLQRYPLAGTERMTQYLGPIICLLAGAGGGWLLERFKPRLRKRAGLVLTGVLVTAGCGLMVRDIVHPYKFPRDWDHQGFARWFWTQDTAEGELYCADRDLGFNFYPTADRSEYFCNQQIYSRRHAAGQKPAGVDALPGDKPIRVVVYSHHVDQPDKQHWQQWLAAMNKKYKLARRDEHRVLAEVYGGTPLYGLYGVYQFVPKPAANVSSRPAAPRR